MLVGGLFPREDQRSTRTDVTKVSRNGVKLLANPPAHVGFIPGGRMTDRHSAIGRLLRRTFPPTGILLGGRDPAQGKEQAIDSGHCLHRCSAVEQQQEFLVFRPSTIERVLEADLPGERVSLNLRRARSLAFSLQSPFARLKGQRPGEEPGDSTSVRSRTRRCRRPDRLPANAAGCATLEPSAVDGSEDRPTR
jgi:hypothetical protein